jgi:hypothetical protein
MGNKMVEEVIAALVSKAGQDAPLICESGQNHRQWMRRKGIERMVEDIATLEIFYTGWHDYQTLLIKAIAPLTTDQHAFCAAPGPRSIGILQCHIGKHSGMRQLGIRLLSVTNGSASCIARERSVCARFSTRDL